MPITKIEAFNEDTILVQFDSEDVVPLPPDTKYIFVDENSGEIVGATYSEDAEEIKQQMDHSIAQNKEVGFDLTLTLYKRVEPTA